MFFFQIYEIHFIEIRLLDASPLHKKRGLRESNHKPYFKHSQKNKKILHSSEKKSCIVCIHKMYYNEKCY